MRIKISAAFSLLIAYVFAQNDIYKDTSNLKVHGKSEILSRRKRFLVFPEGSSFQLVFCNSVPSINLIEDIVMFGFTAALAYELPQDPYSPFRHHADPLHRRTDTKEIFYLDEDGKIIYRRKYPKRKLIVNPAFAKRSVDSMNKSDALQYRKVDRKQMHNSHTREFLKGTFLGKSVEFHRDNRATLYSKIETMIQGLGSNGRECLLKTLCLIGQTQQHPQGTFLEEMLRAVFTLPEGGTQNEEHIDYDKAFSSKESCDILYPDCNEPVKNSIIFQRL